MPIHDYRCASCDGTFELLVRSTDVPCCPRCGNTALERQVSLPAPQGTGRKIIAVGRQAAARAGHLSNYSAADRAKAR